MHDPRTFIFSMAIIGQGLMVLAFFIHLRRKRARNAAQPTLASFDGVYRGIVKTEGLSAAYGEIELTIKDGAAKVRIAQDREVDEETLSLTGFRALVSEEIAQSFGEGYRAEGLVFGFKPGTTDDWPRFFFLYDVPGGTCTHLVVKLDDHGTTLGSTQLLSPAAIALGDFEREVHELKARRRPCHLTLLTPIKR